MKHLLIILCLIANTSIFAQSPNDSTKLSNREILNISNHIKDLEQKNSLKDTLINELENEIGYYIKLHATDTLYSNLQKQEILFYQRQIENYKDLYKVSKPKWYDNKIIWFGIGFGTVIGSSWVVKNVK
jgi:TolA-binding protein